MMIRNLVSKLDTPIVSLGDAKAHLNTVDFPDDDVLISGLCATATQRLDLGGGLIDHALLTQTWEFYARAPEQGGLVIDGRPLQAVTKVEALQSGVYVEIDAMSYVARPAIGGRTLVKMKDSFAWPVADEDDAAFRVTARLGYGDAPASVPAPIRHAALMLVAHLYANRAATAGFGDPTMEMPMGVDDLIAPFRMKVAV